MKYFIYTIIAVVAFAVIAGFFIVGSPQKERLRRFDERRVQDLQIIQSEIIRYWQLKEKLPEELSDLKDDISGFNPPRDPETGTAYTYTAKNKNTFEFCATFSRENQESAQESTITRPYYSEPIYGENWEHKAGEQCFERTIDKELYPPFEKQKIR